MLTMARRAICRYGEPVLRRKCGAVEQVTPEIRQLVRDLLDTMYAAPGVGLAANQIGVPLRICVIDVRPDNKPQPIVLINPRIVEKGKEIDLEEGCLSLPGLMARVKRAEKVRVEALDEKGLPFMVESDGFFGRALQHEIDHLDGKLYIDYLQPWKRKKLEQEIRALKKEGKW